MAARELGLKDLRLQNDGMLVKHLDKFYNNAEVPWVQLLWTSYYQAKVPHLVAPKGPFWWRDVLKLHNTFRGIAKCTTGVGVTSSLCEDLVLTQPWNLQFGNLFHYAKAP